MRNTLRKYLPSGYSVGKGQVYDAFGDGSRQTDVVITNQDHPLTFPDGVSGTYVVDGVAAAGEVKSRLDTAALDDCIAKGSAFKRLRMTINKSDHVVTAKEQAYMKQIGMVPPYFVVAFENHVAQDTLGDRLQNAGLVPPPSRKSLGEADIANAAQPPIDAVCVLGHGVWLYVRPDNPMGMQISFQQPDASKNIRTDLSGWAFIPTDAPLVWTLAWLHAAMPRIFRGGSVFEPYLIPPTRHLTYMNRPDEEATSTPAAVPRTGTENGPNG